MRKIEKFSGKPGHDVSVYEYIEEMTRILKTRPTPKEEQVDFVLSHLEGPAKEEMRFRPIEEKRSSKAVLGQFLGKEQPFLNYSPSSTAQSKHAVNPSKTERDIMLRDQLAENVYESWLRKELKRIVRTHETMSFHDLREEAIAQA